MPFLAPETRHSIATRECARAGVLALASNENSVICARRFEDLRDLAQLDVVVQRECARAVLAAGGDSTKEICARDT